MVDEYVMEAPRRRSPANHSPLLSLLTSRPFFDVCEVETWKATLNMLVFSHEKKITSKSAKGHRCSRQ